MATNDDDVAYSPQTGDRVLVYMKSNGSLLGKATIMGTNEETVKLHLTGNGKEVELKKGKVKLQMDESVMTLGGFKNFTKEVVKSQVSLLKRELFGEAADGGEDVNLPVFDPEAKQFVSQRKFNAKRNKSDEAAYQTWASQFKGKMSDHAKRELWQMKKHLNKNLGNSSAGTGGALNLDKFRDPKDTKEDFDHNATLQAIADKEGFSTRQNFEQNIARSIAKLQKLTGGSENTEEAYEGYLKEPESEEEFYSKVEAATDRYVTLLDYTLKRMGNNFNVEAFVDILNKNVLKSSRAIEGDDLSDQEIYALSILADKLEQANDAEAAGNVEEAERIRDRVKELLMRDLFEELVYSGDNPSEEPEDVNEYETQTNEFGEPVQVPTGKAKPIKPRPNQLGNTLKTFQNVVSLEFNPEMRGRGSHTKR